ncbi:hypothetical protein PTKIN_Ptkin02bG0114300 [Pterospermum kingtungense]
MEKNLNGEKSGNFSRNGKRRSKSISDNIGFNFDGQEPKVFDGHQNPLELSLELDEILEEIDQFIENLTCDLYKLKAAYCIEPLLEMVDSRIATYEPKEASAKFGQHLKEDASFFEALIRISRIINNVTEFPFDSDATFCINRAGFVHHRAMLLLEYEFRALLDNSKCQIEKTPKTPKQSFFNSNQETQYDSKTEDEFPSFSAEAIAIMNQITTSMIFAGYEPECCTVYNSLRLKALDAELNKQGFENINMDDIQRMNWESLGGEIDNWINIVRYCTKNLFPAEGKLCNSVFSEHPLIAQRLLLDLVTSLTLRLLNFPNALVLTKQYSTEKLFKFLDIYETLSFLIPDVGDNSRAQYLIAETSVAQSRVGEAAVNIFCQLENSIKNDNGRIPVASGAVHPLTRYTMNYLKYACEYKDTLERVFQQHHEMLGSTRQKVEEQESMRAIEDDDWSPKTSPLSMKILMVMDLLDANIDMKSKLYRDPALRYIFLMNNGRYILEKIKGSTEIYEMMGHSWSRKRKSDLRQYHKNYQRETWSKVLQCINHEGLLMNGKVSKAILKERFKNFNTLFDEILKTQSTWVVSDEQLQSELRVSISAVVIPAYRSFLGRFKSYLDSSRQTEKYVKYQPEDIEGLIDQLFDGNTTSMGRRRI